MALIFKHFRRSLVFHICNESTKQEVCRINYEETLKDKKAELVETSDSGNIPIELKICTKTTEALITFLKGRVLPPNRMYLSDDLAPLNIQTTDWIELIKLNKGRVHGDDWYIEVEKVDLNENI